MSREQDQLRNLELEAQEQRREADREPIPDERDEVADEERQAALFGAVAESMLEILDQETFRPPPDLPREYQDALELVFEAKAGEEEEIGDGHISAVARIRDLNLGLAALRPVLSIGLAPGAHEMGESYEIIQEKIAELREELIQQGGKEAVGRRKAKDDDDLDQAAGDDDEPEEDEEGEDAADDDGEDEDGEGESGAGEGGGDGEDEE